MNGCTDLDINCQVRKVLVRHWIDLGRVHMRSTRGVVHLRGELCRLYQSKEALNTASVLELISEIRHIRDVRRVTTDFSNWVCKEGTWQLTLGAALTRQQPAEPVDRFRPERREAFDVEAELPTAEEIRKYLSPPGAGS